MIDEFAPKLTKRQQAAQDKADEIQRAQDAWHLASRTHSAATCDRHWEERQLPKYKKLGNKSHARALERTEALKATEQAAKIEGNRTWRIWYKLKYNEPAPPKRRKP